MVSGQQGTDSSASVGGISGWGSGLRSALLIVMLITLVGCVAGFFLSSLQQEREARAKDLFLDDLDEQQRLAETIARHTPRAVNGIESSFARVRHARSRLDDVFAALGAGESSELANESSDDGASQSPRWSEGRRTLLTRLAPALERIRGEWRSLAESIDLILGTEEAVLGLRESLESLSDTTEQLRKRTAKLVALAAAQELESNQVYVISTLALLVERVGGNFRRALDAGSGGLIDVTQYGRDGQLLSTFGRGVNGLLLGDFEQGITQVDNETVRGELEALSSLYRDASEILKAIVSNTLVVVHVKETSETVLAGTQRIPGLTSELRQRVRGISGAPWATQEVRTVMVAAAFVAFVVVVVLLVIDGRARLAAERRLAQEARRQQLESSEVNRRSQEAILRLLDEISALADGDLTTQATVTEDITGAIADAVNYAIEALREIVANINDTSTEVGSAAERTRARSLQLSDATTIQVDRIGQASEALQQMSDSVERIAQQATESSQVAEQSVAIALRGSGAVRDTIAGMDSIRETIQETAKRIKRLGESSQEIGDIVSLIDDIADQTNVLALNATIQASMAGEAGRGFAVVADEVQRLSERAGQATKRIDSLVKTIQSDTLEAVASMEQSTAGVVSGARIAEAAGSSLAEIEAVSQRLASRIDAITSLAREHSEQAAAITSTMQAIREVTTDTQAGTEDTARSIGNLAELADALRESVRGFHLPVRDFTATITLPQQLAARRAATDDVDASVDAQGAEHEVPAALRGVD